eukprot:Gregarina_sp_Poly_1__11074@NODE_890_length_5837_cov_53_476430_g634_i0_p2_GENE_NODE_890_length_5837_cov_53_476430_g634_i0NODE_890_length_5837_cov_53_476430_g634_i0_p2_ORF_typecomplete_len401_score42_88_NODE_890_length_5837_cov_53_476430_g634_i045495751
MKRYAGRRWVSEKVFDLGLDMHSWFIRFLLGFELTLTASGIVLFRHEGWLSPNHAFDADKVEILQQQNRTLTSKAEFEVTDVRSKRTRRQILLSTTTPTTNAPTSPVTLPVATTWSHFFMTEPESGWRAWTETSTGSDDGGGSEKSVSAPQLGPPSTSSNTSDPALSRHRKDSGYGEEGMLQNQMSSPLLESDMPEGLSVHQQLMHQFLVENHLPRSLAELVARSVKPRHTWEKWNRGDLRDVASALLGVQVYHHSTKAMLAHFSDFRSRKLLQKRSLQQSVLRDHKEATQKVLFPIYRDQASSENQATLSRIGWSVSRYLQHKFCVDMNFRDCPNDPLEELRQQAQSAPQMGPRDWRSAVEENEADESNTDPPDALDKQGDFFASNCTRSRSKRRRSAQ